MKLLVPSSLYSFMLRILWGGAGILFLNVGMFGHCSLIFFFFPPPLSLSLSLSLSLCGGGLVVVVGGGLCVCVVCVFFFIVAGAGRWICQFST